MKQSNKQKRIFKEFKKNPLGFIKDEIKAESTKKRKWRTYKLKNKTKIKTFNFIQAIGKWSMIDIYVVALLASIVQLDEIFTIKGGIAATSFALVVVFTMLAAHRFDTRIIWDESR